KIAEEIIINSGNSFLGRIYLPNNVDIIREKVKELLNKSEIDVILISGGTGIGPKDFTIEAISPLFEKTLPGFGEIFRFLSYKKIGTSAIASRAMAGISNKILIFLLPGSPNAVKLALEEIIIQEAPHLIKMIRG
ncbi:MAG: molybdenum cofactor biosynthesis protein B, partial [Candidatus Methanomethylicaceae archaeon]